MEKGMTGSGLAGRGASLFGAAILFATCGCAAGSSGPEATGMGIGVATDTDVDVEDDADDTTDPEEPYAKLDVGPSDAPAEPPSEEECVAETQEASVESLPVDIVLIADTSSSMGEAVDAVEASINDDFADILARVSEMKWEIGGRLG